MPVSPFAGSDETLLTAIGVAATVEQVLDQPGGADELTDRLGESDAHPSPTALSAIHRAVAVVEEPLWPNPPEQLRVADGDQTRVVAVDDVTVVVAPHHAVLSTGPSIAGPEVLAEILDLSTSTTAPPRILEHNELEILGHSVDWWANADGTVHAATQDGLARAVAWVCGQWGRRWELAALLCEPEGSARDWIDRSFDDGVEPACLVDAPI
jgi:hypothetical protein